MSMATLIRKCYDRYNKDYFHAVVIAKRKYLRYVRKTCNKKTLSKYSRWTVLREFFSVKKVSEIYSKYGEQILTKKQFIEILRKYNRGEKIREKIKKFTKMWDDAREFEPTIWKPESYEVYRYDTDYAPYSVKYIVDKCDEHRVYQYQPCIYEANERIHILLEINFYYNVISVSKNVLKHSVPTEFVEQVLWYLNLDDLKFLIDEYYNDDIVVLMFKNDELKRDVYDFIKKLYTIALLIEP